MTGQIRAKNGLLTFEGFEEFEEDTCAMALTLAGSGKATRR
jgi:hypothetical protein